MTLVKTRDYDGGVHVYYALPVDGGEPARLQQPMKSGQPQYKRSAARGVQPEGISQPSQERKGWEKPS